MTVGTETVAPGSVTPPPPMVAPDVLTPTPGRLTVAPGTETPPPPAETPVLETPTVLTLLASGHVVVAAGGGGIPVVRQSDGALRGVEAVIDKDLTAALLATAVGADALVIATDVEHVVLGWGTSHERALGSVTPADLEAYAAQGEFASGSMGPKVEAALRFVRSGGSRAVITELHSIAVTLAADVGTAGRVGTIVENP